MSEKPDQSELEAARESLAREFERLAGGPTNAPYLLQRLERLIDAKISETRKQ